jgi:hypothetical protein
MLHFLEYQNAKVIHKTFCSIVSAIQSFTFNFESALLVTTEGDVL